jgi:hypothetical protein
MRGGKRVEEGNSDMNKKENKRSEEHDMGEKGGIVIGKESRRIARDIEPEKEGRKRTQEIGR